MAEDKRIIKTKRNLKRTLTEMLAEEPFEHMTVSELCRRAETSRITFYTYYDDKFALVEDMMHDFYAEADQLYHELQRQNNPEGDGIRGYQNLLECILGMAERHPDFFSHVSAEQNPDLSNAFFKAIYAGVRSYILRHTEQIRARYSADMIAALICAGFAGVISVAYLQGTSGISRESLTGMYHDLLESNLFIRE